MKTINQYISEKLHINKDVKDPYSYHPKTKEELIECIKEKIEKEGLGTKEKPLDLNDIDTSKIADMSYLFHRWHDLASLSKTGYFDISDWDVSNVEDMRMMFQESKFNGNISRWDVSKVKNMHGMFNKSNFNGNISDWDVSNVEYMKQMFYNCPLQNNPPKWYKRK